MTAPPLIFDRESSRAVDRAAIEEYGISGIVLMENAAKALAETALDMLGGQEQMSVLIICGSGNNGGDGYAAARHLHNAGCEVTICRTGQPRERTDAAINRAICKRMNLREISQDELTAGRGGPAPPARPAPSLLFRLIIDALFGTGLDRPVEGVAADVIRWINESRSAGSLVLAADIPSGLDCDTGRELGVAVRADRTVSFLGMKKGFLEAGADQYTGEIVIGDIGAPVELVARFGRPT